MFLLQLDVEYQFQNSWNSGEDNLISNPCEHSNIYEKYYIDHALAIDHTLAIDHAQPQKVYITGSSKHML